ncbi:TadE/TadG family type IV pilus assembly protein [Streptomyces sp. NRRL F-5123]|uniref:TadE/TadG family type IV pilus assembly protein n=1 Tax=Streptomyces sp. NRRL F-5123 TaxID=1463856 RepID=UPI0004E10310|nr:TadE/TadG family type IV pilus assembly protein [Streptomyces sp. NRRL F-5123]
MSLHRLWTFLRRDDGGSVTAEMLFVLPVLFTLVLLLAQVTVWWHATHIAQATAADALAATRVQGGTTAAGQTEADRVLDQLGRGPLESVHVSVTRGADRAQVRITGTASSVVPFVHLPVRATAAGPVERFRPADGTS